MSVLSGTGRSSVASQSVRWLVLAIAMGLFALACKDLAGPGSCDAGYCLNYFASNIEAACCPADFPYYCNGTDKCYQTFEDAYFGRSCTLPQGRTCF